MKIKVGVIGLGYWGPNYIRNFIRHKHSEVVWACDLSNNSINKIRNIYPHIKSTNNYHDILNDDKINLVAIATPPTTHYKIVMDSLSSNKHTLVAKPLATKKIEANKLVKLAKRKKLLLHTDLTYLYTGSIIKIKKLLKKGIIGKPLYYDSVRTNMGLLQKNINVIWDLAPHDFSILSYLFNYKPTKLIVTGSKHIRNSKEEEMAHISVYYSSGFVAQIHLSWLSPIKIRTISVGGSKKMIVFDDVQHDEKLRIYDKGVKVSPGTITPFKPLYRSGEITIPKVDNEEALYTEINEVLNQVIAGRISYENAEISLGIIKFLESCDKSLKTNQFVKL